MKDSEARRAEREARADVVARGRATSRPEGALARFLAAMGHDRDADADKRDGAHREREKPTP